MPTGYGAGATLYEDTVAETYRSSTTEVSSDIKIGPVQGRFEKDPSQYVPLSSAATMRLGPSNQP